jgi:DNA repair protein RadC
MHSEEYRSLKNLAPDDRPREKLWEKGSSALSDAELIAILIGSGSRKESAVDLSRRLLASVNNNLADFGKLGLAQLSQFYGMGAAKAAVVAAAIELGRRRRSAEAMVRINMQGARDVFEYIHKELGDLQHEEFWVLFLNRSNQVIGTRRVSEGGLHSTVVDPKKVLSLALELRACAFIAAHNHPSGTLSPSREDQLITNKLAAAGRMLDCPLLDHLIITTTGYFSFAEHNLIEV